MPKGKRRHKDTFDGMSGGIFLIGFGVLFLIDGIDFWPWILAVIGLSSLPASVARDGLWAGSQGFLWMTGLAILFAANAFWPGILILIGLSIIIGSMVRPPALDKAKRKRGEPLDDDEYV